MDACVAIVSNLEEKTSGRRQDNSFAVTESSARGIVNSDLPLCERIQEWFGPVVQQPTLTLGATLYFSFEFYFFMFVSIGVILILI